MTKTSRSIRYAALASASLIVLSASSAWAQEAVAEDEGGLTEIVVTAQKREQNLQDVPAAISAFSADDLVRRGVSETSD